MFDAPVLLHHRCQAVGSGIRHRGWIIPANGRQSRWKALAQQAETAPASFFTPWGNGFSPSKATAVTTRVATLAGNLCKSFLVDFFHYPRRKHPKG